jgi:hypothetical protein
MRSCRAHVGWLRFPLRDGSYDAPLPPKRLKESAAMGGLVRDKFKETGMVDLVEVGP